MNDTVKNFKTKIDLLPKNPKDVNILFAVSYAEYKGYVAVLDALLLPNSIFKDALTGAATSLDNTAYSNITKGMNALNVVKKAIIPSPFNKNMDVSVGAVGELLALACTDYMGSVPEDLFNLFQDAKHKINKASHMLLGPGLMNIVLKDVLKIKDDAMKELFGGDIFNAVLSPVIAYENFLKDNGVNDLIKRMEKLERCMTKPGIGGRPKSDFIDPVSKKVYSVHYKSLFMVNSKGKISIKSLGINNVNKSQMSNVMKTMSNFRVTII
jgi:hypothetical protein